MITVKKTLAFGVAALAVSGMVMTANDAVTISDKSQNSDSFSGKDVTISGKSEVHLTSKTPLSNSSVNLLGENAWLYFDAVKPTVVQSTYLKDIKVDGQAADVATNVRLAQYRGGTVVIPHGFEANSKALTVYKKINCSGDSKEFEIETHHKDLGDFDNSIRSFKLRKGYMAVLANNPDGTGHSRCYIADTDDLVVNELPDGFVTKDGTDKAFVSYIRVVKWNWVSKKGWAGSDKGLLDLTNSTHYYGWDAGSGNKSIDYEYSPQRHHIGWPGYGEIWANTNVTHALQYNEPDNDWDDKEHPATPYQAACEWPDMLRSGLRLGSAAPTNVGGGNWLSKFFALADSLNYRCDVVVFHMYEHSTAFSSRVGTAVSASNGRPAWITEYNNGANWTTGNENDWPNKEGQQCDADGNPISGAGSVSLPNTTGNADKTYNYIKASLESMDNIDKLERTHFYNWVQDARSVAINGKLTKGGKFFADYNSKLAYRESAAYQHEWKIAPPLPFIELANEYKDAHLWWYDHNGETGQSYTVWRKDDSGKYEAIKVLEAGKDYEPGSTVHFYDPVNMPGKRYYYISATAYDGKTVSKNSRKHVISRDNEVSATTVSGTAPNYRSVKLSWDPVEGARGFRIERADAPNAEFKKVDETKGTTLSTTIGGLTSGADYYFRVASLSNADFTPISEVIKVHVGSIDEAPEGVNKLMSAAGDKKVSLSWEKTYQTTYKIERATEPNGAYTELTKDFSKESYEDTGVENGKTYYYRITPDRLGMQGPAAVVEATPEEGRFFYMPFVEGRGQEAFDVYGGNKATFKEGLYWVDDRNDNARSAVKQLTGSCIQLPNNITKELGDYTISMWMKYGTTSGRLFDFGSSTSKFFILNYDGNGTWRYKLTTGSQSVDSDSSPWKKNISKTSWHHVCLTQTGTTVTLYVDGEKVGSKTGALKPSAMGATSNNMLGHSQWPADPTPNYTFDDVYIFNHGMTEAEVKELMNTKGMGIEEIALDGAEGEGMAVYGLNGELTIMANSAAKVDIYSVDGRLVRTVNVNEGLNTFAGFENGIYVVAGAKVRL